MTEQVNVYDAATPSVQTAGAGRGRQGDRDRPHRTPGAWSDKVWTSDVVDEPDEELIDLFYNGPIFPDPDEARGAAGV